KRKLPMRALALRRLVVPDLRTNGQEAELRVEQAQSLNLREFTFDQARADISPIARIGQNDFICQRICGIACRFDGFSSAGDNEGIATCPASNQRTIVQRNLTVMNMSLFGVRKVAIEHNWQPDRNWHCIAIIGKRWCGNNNANGKTR